MFGDFEKRRVYCRTYVGQKIYLCILHICIYIVYVCVTRRIRRHLVHLFWKPSAYTHKHLETVSGPIIALSTTTIASSREYIC